MFLSVDATGVGRHLEILSSELREASYLLDSLKKWYNDTLNEETENSYLILTQVNFADRQCKLIKDRIKYLEKLQNTIIALKQTISSELDELI